MTMHMATTINSIPQCPHDVVTSKYFTNTLLLYNKSRITFPIKSLIVKLIILYENVRFKSTYVLIFS